MTHLVTAHTRELESRWRHQRYFRQEAIANREGGGELTPAAQYKTKQIFVTAMIVHDETNTVNNVDRIWPTTALLTR